MSRLAKKSIKIPEKIKVKVEEGKIQARGPEGENELKLPDNIDVKKSKNELKVEAKKKSRQAKQNLGTIWSLLKNLIEGVNKGHQKTLTFKGVGYRAQANGNKLTLKIGYSHDVEIVAPKKVNFEVKKDKIIVKGVDKQLVGEYAARVRKVRPVDPYKQKGIKYEDEVVIQKEGKAVEKLEEEG